MANRKDLENYVTQIQDITQRETGIRPERGSVSGLFRKRGNRFFIPTDQTPQWLRDSIVGGSKPRQN